MKHRIKHQPLPPRQIKTKRDPIPKEYMDKVHTPNAMGKLKERISIQNRRRQILRSISSSGLQYLKQRFSFLKPIIKALDIMPKQTKPKTLKQKFEESSTYKGIVEIFVGLSLFGLSEEVWLNIIGIGLAVIGMIDTIRRERKDGDD